jgi:hypothetical protein
MGEARLADPDVLALRRNPQRADWSRGRHLCHDSSRSHGVSWQNHAHSSSNSAASSALEECLFVAAVPSTMLTPPSSAASPSAASPSPAFPKLRAFESRRGFEPAMTPGAHSSPDSSSSSALGGCLLLAPVSSRGPVPRRRTGRRRRGVPWPRGHKRLAHLCGRPCRPGHRGAPTASRAVVAEPAALHSPHDWSVHNDPLDFRPYVSAHIGLSYASYFFMFCRPSLGRSRG